MNSKVKNAWNNMRRHLREYPNDGCARAALDRLEASLNCVNPAWREKFEFIG